MFKLLNKKKGQSTMEYAVLIIIIVGALLAVQVYIKRGVQGRMKSSADDIGEQYSPGNTNVIKTTTTHSQTQEDFGVAGQGLQSTNMLAPETTNTRKAQQILNVDQEFWGHTP
jgi:hypothetical protein